MNNNDNPGNRDAFREFLSLGAEDVGSYALGLEQNRRFLDEIFYPMLKQVADEYVPEEDKGEKVE